MKKLATIFTLFLGFISPIELSIILLMGAMGVDTIVKLVSLKIQSKRDGRRYMDVFASKMLRKGYILKGSGYLLFALAVFPLDFYMLTPFTKGFMQYLSIEYIVVTKAIFTNILLIIFCIIELASINENWFDISGNNILKSVKDTVVILRDAINGVIEFIGGAKNNV
jgi:hypothetical protein